MPNSVNSPRWVNGLVFGETTISVEKSLPTSSSTTINNIKTTKKFPVEVTMTALPPNLPTIPTKKDCPEILRRPRYMRGGLGSGLGSGLSSGLGRGLKAADREGTGRSIVDRAFAHYRVRNPIYHTYDEKDIDSSEDSDRSDRNAWSPQTFTFSFGSQVQPLSKFAWANRYVPMAYLDKILPQLKEGNEFTLTLDEWLTGSFTDMLVYAGYFDDLNMKDEKDEKYEKYVRIKLTNNDRRRLLKSGLLKS